MNKQLQIGDVLFTENRFSGLKRLVVESVTPKMAKCGRYTLYRIPKNGDRYDEYGGNNVAYLSNPEYEKRWERMNLMYQYKDLVENSIRKFPTNDQMERIINILNETK